MSTSKTQYRGSGVYLFRTRRPGVLGRLPIWALPIMIFVACVCAHVAGAPWWVGFAAILLSPHHTAYVGMSMHVRGRRAQHLFGSVRYNEPAKPWADLFVWWGFIPVPPFKPILLTVETLLILAAWPVYNHQKNLWNPRRIPLKSAKRQRGQRDFAGWSFNARYGHAVLGLAGYVLLAANVGWFPWG